MSCSVGAIISAPAPFGISGRERKVREDSGGREGGGPSENWPASDGGDARLATMYHK